MHLSALEQLQQGTGSPAFLLRGFSPDDEKPAGELGFTSGPLCPVIVIGPSVLWSLCHSHFLHDLCLSWVYKVFLKSGQLSQAEHSCKKRDGKLGGG